MPTHPLPWIGWIWAVVAVTALALLAAAMLAASPADAASKRNLYRFASGPISFGIYPGGGAGTFGPAGRTLPEDPALRLAALKQLRGDSRRFVLHLYDEFRRRGDGAAVPAWLAAQIGEYTAHGFEVELVLRYRPNDPAGDVAGFAEFVRNRVHQLGPNRGITGLQVTNEVNVRVAPDAGDGAYKRSNEALVHGVVAAKQEVRNGGFGQLRVGFNWAFQGGASEPAFWRSLHKISKREAGGAFNRSVDWVGLDAYPGTWGPWHPAGGSFSAGVRKTTVTALRQLRDRYLRLARLGKGVRLHISEAGYPTGPGRSEAAQRTALQSMTRTIVKYRKRFGVTDYRWFDLRDAHSANQSFESQYGLMRDDYSPKPAFAAYRSLVNQLGSRAR